MVSVLKVITSVFVLAYVCAKDFGAWLRIPPATWVRPRRAVPAGRLLHGTGFRRCRGVWAAPGAAAEIIRAAPCGSSPSAAEVSRRAWAAVPLPELRAARHAAVRLFRTVALRASAASAGEALPELEPRVSAAAMPGPHGDC